ncbi:MAG: sulfotransferase [Dokdonella sp.]
MLPVGSDFWSRAPIREAAPAFDRMAGLSAAAVGFLAAIDAALRQRNVAEMQRALTALLALAPTHPEVLRVRAAIARLQGQRGNAIELLRRALDSRPGDVVMQGDLGHALADNGDFAAALDAFRACAELEPTRAIHWLNSARLFERLGQTARVHDAVGHALEREPHNATARLLLARTLQFMGRVNDAHAQYRQVLASAPAAAMAWHGLSTLRTARFDADDLAQIEQVCARTDLRDHERAAGLFSLAKALEDADRHMDSYAALVAANAVRRKQLYWDAAVFSRHIRAIEQAFTELPATPSEVSDGRDIIFLVGMPRSGSTLIEQILCAHPQVTAGGELTDLSDIIRLESERRGGDFPSWVADADARDWQRLGRSYLERIAHRRGTRPLFTDKALLNWRYIGAIRAMLPGARIIDCRRDALETCLGAFRQMFASDLAFTYDLAELVALWRDYNHAMHVWDRRYPGCVLEVMHERLTLDPEREIRALLDFCGLPFDPACLRFHEVERSVQTASAAQVREPLRTDTARAHRYGSALDPLREMLAQAVESPF